MVKLVPADQPVAPRRRLVPADAPEPQDSSFLGGLVDSFTQGVAFGFGDELTAAEAATLGSVPGESWRERYDQALAMEREQNRRFRENNPVAATAAEVAGGVATAMTPVGAIGSGMKGGVTLGNMAKGAAAGAGYGGLYGFGTGEGGAVERAANVPLSAGIGAAGGALAVPVAAGAGRLSRALAERAARRGAADTAGLSPRAYNYLRTAAEVADTSYPGGAAARIRSGGPDAMLADVMPGQADLVANVGAGAPIARRNLTERVGRASRSVDEAMNATFGQPRGVKEVAREISSSTRGARGQAYDAAYTSPIDYSTGGPGERILGIIDRIPRQTFRAAIDEANDAMTAAGVRNKQILVDIAEDGSIAFREMPNVQQLDEIKKALQTIGRENVDQFGRPTARGIRADGLARELRDALGEAVPAYNEAVRLGGDKIAQDQALEMGRRLLTGSTSVEDAVAAAGRLQGAEQMRLREGVRYYLDDMLGRVKATRTDPNIDAREAWKGIQELSSRNNREKLRAVLGQAEADDFLARIDEASRAFEVRATAAGNSATMPRSAQLQALEGGGRAFPEARQGPPPTITDLALSLPARGWNRMTGNTPAARESRMAGDLTALAERITGLRGEEAVQLFQRLLQQNQALQAAGQQGGRLSQFLRRSTPLAAAPAAQPLIQP